MTIAFDNKLHSIVFGGGNIDEYGMNTINKTLYTWGLPYLPEWWDWQACVKKGKYCGTFVKRAKKWYREQNINFTQKQASDLGSLVGTHSQKPKTYLFRFTINDWQDGDFADEDSCYWNSKYYCRDIIRKNKGGAVQFFNVETEDNKSELEKLLSIADIQKNGYNGLGLGRAWILPHKKHTKDLIVFNGYGITTINVAKILSQFLNLNYERVPIVNNRIPDHKSDADLYINGNNHGYIISNDIDKYHNVSVDLDINTLKLLTKCKYCYGYYFKKDIKNRQCSECIDNLINCSKCNQLNVHDNMHTYITGYPYLCPKCVRKTGYCTKCHKYKFLKFKNKCKTLFCLDCYPKPTKPTKPTKATKTINIIHSIYGIQTTTCTHT